MTSWPTRLAASCARDRSDRCPRAYSFGQVHERLPAGRQATDATSCCTWHFTGSTCRARPEIHLAQSPKTLHKASWSCRQWYCRGCRQLQGPLMGPRLAYLGHKLPDPVHQSIIGGPVVASPHGSQHSGAAALSRHVQLLGHVRPGCYDLPPQSLVSLVGHASVWGLGPEACMQCDGPHARILGILHLSAPGGSQNPQRGAAEARAMHDVL